MSPTARAPLRVVIPVERYARDGSLVAGGRGNRDRDLWLPNGGLCRSDRSMESTCTDGMAASQMDWVALAAYALAP
jgi:hypothetical protein